MRHNGASYYFYPRVKVEANAPACEYFNILDDDFLDGSTKERPPDFSLHLALYILAKEHLPPELLEPLEQWVQENKMVVA